MTKSFVQHIKQHMELHSPTSPIHLSITNHHSAPSLTSFSPSSPRPLSPSFCSVSKRAALRKWVLKDWWKCLIVIVKKVSIVALVFYVTKWIVMYDWKEGKDRLSALERERRGSSRLKVKSRKSVTVQVRLGQLRSCNSFIALGIVARFPVLFP